jgi:glycosyltransferase involved in cell wall biosynthesis
MTRVMMVSPEAREGGAARAFASLVDELPAHGIEPVPVLLERGPLEGWLADCHMVESRPFHAWRLHDTSRTVRALKRFARRSGARVVVSSKARGHLFGGPAAAAARLPAVWWMHEMPPEGLLYRRHQPWRQYHVEEAARFIPAARVVCGNDHAVRLQRARRPGTPVVKIRPGLFVDDVVARRGEGADLRRRLGVGRAPLVGVVGRFAPYKGQDVFLRAASRIARRRADTRFALVGGDLLQRDGEYMRAVERVARSGPLAGRVFLPGHQSDPLPWLDALDVVVVPSLSEVGPLVLAEALALGKPVVTARVGAVPDVVRDGRDALVVPPGDDVALEAGVERILEDPDLARRLAAAGPVVARAFSHRAMGRDFAALIAQLA